MNQIQVLKKDGLYLLIKQFGQPYIRYIGSGAPESIFQIQISEKEKESIIECDKTMKLLAQRKMHISEQDYKDYQLQTITDFLTYHDKCSVAKVAKIINHLAQDEEIIKEYYEFVLTGRMSGANIVEGHSAITLSQQYHLSGTACYLTLVSLQNDSLNTTKQLQNAKRA